MSTENWDYDEAGHRLWPLSFKSVQGEPLHDGFGSIRFGHYIYRPLSVTKERIVQTTSDHDTLILLDTQPLPGGKYRMMTCDGARDAVSMEEWKAGRLNPRQPFSP
jgi:hypothetical protein